MAVSKIEPRSSDRERPRFAFMTTVMTVVIKAAKPESPPPMLAGWLLPPHAADSTRVGPRNVARPAGARECEGHGRPKPNSHPGYPDTFLRSGLPGHCRRPCPVRAGRSDRRRGRDAEQERAWPA